MEQRLSLRLRLRARLYYLATREVELAEGMLLAFSLNRVVLLLWPPVELSVLGFYDPLVNTLQLVLWSILAAVKLYGLLSGDRRIRVAGLVGGVALWTFAGLMTLRYADSKHLAISSFLLAVFSFGVLLRLGARWPRSPNG